MGRISGSKNAADYFGGFKKTQDKGQQGGFKRLFSIFKSPSTRASAEGPSARASASFLINWRSAHHTADVLTLDQSSPSFDGLTPEDRWESVIDLASRKKRSGREDSASEEEEDAEEEEEEEEEEVEEEPSWHRGHRQHRKSSAQQREDDYRPQPKQHAAQRQQQQQQQQQQPLQAASRQQNSANDSGVESSSADSETQLMLAAQRRQQQQLMLQQLHRQATERGSRDEDRPQRLEYQAWDPPARAPHPTRQCLLPTPPQPQPPPTKLDYTPHHRHLEAHPQAQLQSQSQKLLSQSLLHPQPPPLLQQQQQQLLPYSQAQRQDPDKEQLRLPPCTPPPGPQSERFSSPALVRRERGATVAQAGDSPLRGPGTTSRRFLEMAASAAAEEAALLQKSGETPRVAGGGFDADTDADEDEDGDAQPFVSGATTRESFDRSRSMGRPGAAAAARCGEARPITPTRLGQGTQQLRLPVQATPSTMTTGTTPAPLGPHTPPGPPPAPLAALRKESSVRFSVASGPSASASAVNVSVDSNSPSRRTSISGAVTDAATMRRAALLREASNGASSMRATVQRLRTSNNGSTGGGGSPIRRPAGSNSGTASYITGGADEYELVPERSQAGQPRDTSHSGSLPQVRLSNPGTWTAQTRLSVRLRHDLENRVAAEEASTSASASASVSAAVSAAASPSVPPPRPRWKDMLEEASAALEGSGVSNNNSQEWNAGAGMGAAYASGSRQQSSSLNLSVAEAEGGGGSTSNGSTCNVVAGTTTAAAVPLSSSRTLVRADTCADAPLLATPAARAGRVLQRANTQPARFSLDEDVKVKPATDNDDSDVGELLAARLRSPALAGATGGGGGMPPAGPSNGSALRGTSRRCGFGAPALAPVPPPTRMGGAAGSTLPASRRISEASGGPLVLPVAPAPPAGRVSSSGDGAPASALSSGHTAASPRIVLAERARERSMSGAAPGGPLALDSPPLGPAPPSGALASSSSFGRRGQQLIDPPGAVSVSPRRLPRHSSPQGSSGPLMRMLPMPPTHGSGMGLNAPLAPPMAPCRVSLTGGSGDGAPPASGPHDDILDALRSGPTGGKKAIESEASAGAGAWGGAGSSAATVGLMRPRPRRLGDGARAGPPGQMWPVPP